MYLFLSYSLETSEDVIGGVFDDNSGIIYSFLHKNICCGYLLEVPL